MRAARFETFGPPSVLRLVELPPPSPARDEAVVAVRAAAINPSDVKNVEGKFPQTRPPRTPGRDFAGVVTAGPREWMGAEVWGSGGDLGFTRDGTHADAVVVPVAALRRKPARLSFGEAAAAGTPFVTAQLGLARASASASDVVLVVGAAGAVGGAAVRIAARRAARVIGVVRDEAQAEKARAAGAADVVLVRRGEDATAALVRALGESAVDVAYDTSGASLDACVRVLRHGGRVVAITAPPDGMVTFDLRALYRRDARILGIDSVKLTAVDAAAILEALAPGFDAGVLGAPAFIERPLAAVADAYAARDKIVLVP